MDDAVADEVADGDGGEPVTVVGSVGVCDGVGVRVSEDERVPVGVRESVCVGL